MTNLRRFFWGCLWSGLVIGGGCLWQVLAQMPTVPAKPVTAAHKRDIVWFVTVEVTGQSGVKCLLRFQQYDRETAGMLNSTTCPVQDANGRIVAKEGF